MAASSDNIMQRKKIPIRVAAMLSATLTWRARVAIGPPALIRSMCRTGCTAKTNTSHVQRETASFPCGTMREVPDQLTQTMPHIVVMLHFSHASGGMSNTLNNHIHNALSWDVDNSGNTTRMKQFARAAAQWRNRAQHDCTSGSRGMRSNNVWWSSRTCCNWFQIERRRGKVPMTSTGTICCTCRCHQKHVSLLERETNGSVSRICITRTDGTMTGDFVSEGTFRSTMIIESKSNGR